jgi:hypothetical protein
MPSKEQLARCALVGAFILALLSPGATGHGPQTKDTIASLDNAVRVGSGHGTVSPPELKPLP